MQYEVGYYLHHSDYEEAIRLLNSEDYKYPDDPSWNLFYGKCKYELDHQQEALKYLKFADSLGVQDRDMNFYLGELLHKQNEFAHAKNYYLNYFKELEKYDKDKVVKEELVRKRIKECDFGIDFKKTSKPIEIVNLGGTINSEYPDYAPVISADEQTMFFTSRRPSTTGGLKDARDGWHLEDIFICVKDSLNNWSKPEHLPGYINSNGHDADIGLSPDGQKLFIYRDDETEYGLAGDIYVSNWKFDRWSSPEKLPAPINTSHWETGASTTPDEKTIYFSSNRPGGFGGLDIYKIRQLPNGDWALPINLGPKINTPYDDESPFIHPDGRTLYFSSEGHSSMGGFDIFYSELDDTVWSKPVNLGYPLNTGQNELYFVLSADARRGYFSGIRSETFGDQDIYMANLPEKPVQIILLKGRVVDMQSEKPLATLLKVYDNASKELVYVLNSNAVNGRFSSVLPPHKNYNIQVEVDQPGYAHYSVNIHVPDQKEFVEIDTVIRLQKDDTVHVVTLLPNIFFELNTAKIDSTSELELDALAKRMFENPELNLEIAMHTYSQPTKEDNRELSQKRADAVKDELVNRGIESHRIFPVGYGDLFPSSQEAKKWEETGEKPKDRAEAIIIEDFKEDYLASEDGFYFKSGRKPFNSDDLDEAGLIAMDENEEIKEFSPDEIEEDNKSTNSEINKIPDTSDLLIFFRFNKIYFRESPDSVFAILTDLLKRNPELNLEIKSYTDSVGHPDYNKFLSQIRADYVKKKLIEKGIESERLIPIGFGQMNPRFDNGTVQGRLNNRRAEFEVVPNENYVSLRKTSNGLRSNKPLVLNQPINTQSEEIPNHINKTARKSGTNNTSKK